MSLEKHEKAAAQALHDWSCGDEALRLEEEDALTRASVLDAARTAIEAFLSSLADDPPEEMLEAAAANIDGDQEHADRKARLVLEAALSAALRQPLEGHDDE